MGLPTISPTRVSGGFHYRVRWEKPRDPATGGRKWDSATFDTELEAEKFRARLILEQSTDNSRMKLADFLTNEWLPDYRERREPSSYGSRCSIVRNWLIPTWGAVRLRDLDARAIERGLSTARKRGASPGRAKAVLDTLSAALNVAVRWGMLADNPCKNVGKLEVRRPKRPKIWTDGQTAAFFAVQDRDPWVALWASMAGTSVRINEALALQWGDLQWVGEVPVIQVLRGWATGPEGKYLGPPKSEDGERDVEIPPELVEILHERKAAQAERAWGLRRQVTDETFIFTTPDLRPLAYSTVSYQWKKAIADAEVPYMKMHGLRHLGITAQILAGIPLKTVSVRAGHSSMKITADVYSHVLLENQHAAAAVLGRLITRQRDENVTDITPRIKKSAEA